MQFKMFKKKEFMYLKSEEVQTLLYIQAIVEFASSVD